MRKKKAYLVIVILLLGSLAGNRVCAQFTPGDRLSELKWPYTTNFDFEHGNKGFVRLVGADTPKDQCCYSFLQELCRKNVLECLQMELYLL